MNLTVMNFNRIRDLISNLGWTGDDQTYIAGPDCLGTLEKLEDELLNEDVVKRNVRIGLHMCGAVQKDLIPILKYVNDAKVVSTATRVLVNLSLPIEYLISFEESSLPSKHPIVLKHLSHSSLAIKRAFLDASATLSLVTVLRETMIKSEKHFIPLSEEDCSHLKNCLLLLRNILHLPDYKGLFNDVTIQMCHDWQSIQSKLIWNLFVQGIDGALLLMLNSKYKAHWTVPMALIIALLYKNQNVGKIHQSLDAISSSSETSEDDDESDGSKNSSASLSSEASKYPEILSDSGCPPPSEILKSKRRQLSFDVLKNGSPVADIHTKLEKVQISDDNGCALLQPRDSKPNVHLRHEEIDSESSSSSESPYHKKIKGSISSSDDGIPTTMHCSVKTDSAISMDRSSPEIINKSSDDDIFDETKPAKNLKAVQKLRCLQISLKTSESDSSNEDIQSKKIKYRSHPPTGRRGKSPRRNNGCIPSVCMKSAYEVSSSKGRIRFPLWEKRNSVSTLVDIHSSTPSDDDIGNLLKEFTLSFMHSGFSQLVVDLKNLLIEGQSYAIDKSLFFWLLSYFLHLATSANISFEHISDILSLDIISFLVFECANACENLELHSHHNEKITRYVTVHLELLVIALKEVMCTLDLYSRKCNTPKNRALISELCGKLAGLQDLRNIPHLLFRCRSQSDDVRYLENIIILNHEILIVVGRGFEHCREMNKINFSAHLKTFSTSEIVSCYGKVLENFKQNGHFLNDCVFNMLHHLAGDIRSFELLFQPLILKVFSKILKEEMELEQYQEDLIMYILNKFSLQVYQKNLKEEKANKSGLSTASSETSSNSCLSSSCVLSEEEDDLFWWYLQFEQDKDPISRISEYISTSKRDILSKLQLKGHISEESYKRLEEKMEAAQDNDKKVLSSDELAHISNFDDGITLLLRALVQAGHRQYLIWLQDILLEVCSIKLGSNYHVAESIPFYSIKMMLSVPLVPFTEEQWNVLQDKIFLQLLTKLGLHLGSGVCQMYPRIPLFWSADMLYNIACRLGPVKKDKLKFSHEELILASPGHDSTFIKDSECPALPPLSSCLTLSSWLTAVKQSKEIYKENQKNNLTFKFSS